MTTPEGPSAGDPQDEPTEEGNPSAELLSQIGWIWSSVEPGLTCQAHDGTGQPIGDGVLDVACQPGWAPTIRLIASPRECILTPDEADALAAALTKAAGMVRAEPIEGHL